MKNLKLIRKARGLKQKELANIVGVSESAISQYENGKKQPSFEIALKLAEALDCESADLVSERDISIIKKEPVTAGDGPVEVYHTVSDEDYNLVTWFRSLSPEKQKAILISQDAPEGLS